MQSHHANTPAIASKMSIVSLNIQMVIDLFFQFWHLVYMAAVNNYFVYFMIMIFGKLVCFAWYLT